MSRLTTFLLISTTLHVSLLAGGASLGRIDAGMHTESIVVRLDDEGRGTRPAAPWATPGNTSDAQTTNHGVPVQTVAMADTRVASSEKNTTAKQQHATPSTGETVARVQAQVLSDLARYFYYPAMARQRGWEGRVLLAFRVEQDGLLHEPRVVRTSGFGVLDAAALNSLRKVERIADAGGVRYDLEIPVVYRLTDTR